MGGLNKLFCFIIYSMLLLISQALCHRVRFLDSGFNFKHPVSSHNVLTTEPGLDLDLHRQNIQVRPPAAGYMSADVNHPSGLELSHKSVGKVILQVYGKQGSLYRPLVLNLLPKGTPIPPSGPSKRSNNLSN